MQAATREMMLEKLSDIRNEISLISSETREKHFAGSGQVRRLADQVKRLETVVTHLVQSI
jgi:hypothetical protein